MRELSVSDRIITSDHLPVVLTLDIEDIPAYEVQNEVRITRTKWIPENSIEFATKINSLQSQN